MNNPEDRRTYRVKIEEMYPNKNKHVEQFTFDCNDVDTSIRLVKLLLHWEIEDAQHRHVTRQSFVSNILQAKARDEIDYTAMGSDITPEEFIENEIAIQREED